LRWQGKFHGFEIESLELLTDNHQGLLVERTVAYRPFPVVRILREEMYKDLKDILGPEYREYPSRKRPGI
jgi:protein-S-isoprenylcysteine O-methyltransferase Ste14